MRILLADDQEFVRDAIAGFIRVRSQHEVTCVSDLAEARDAVEECGPFDLVMLDYQMPGMSGLRGMTEIMALQGDKPVTILSGAMPAPLVQQVFQAGGAGYFPKTMSATSLLAAVEMVMAGGSYAPLDLVMAADKGSPASALPSLSNREAMVLRHVCQGMTNMEIARELGLHEATVKVHVRSICLKVDARNRTEATIIAREAGFC